MTETNYIHANARFAFKNDTASNWESKNPTLLSGEFGVVNDGNETERVKIGDGVTPWNELPWWKGSKGNDGYTPQKSIDYFTEDDKGEIVELVLADLPVSEEGEF